MGEDGEDYWSGYDQNPDPGGGDYSAGDGGDVAVIDEGGAIDNGDGSFTYADGSIWQDGEYLGEDNGDGTWTDFYGNVYDQDNNLVQAPTPAPGMGIDPSSGGILDGVKNFFSGLFGGDGRSGGNQGGGAGGGFGSGGSGSQQQQANQLANQLAQQLARAQQTGAPASTIAQLQQQLSLARQTAAALAGNDTQKLILIAAAVGLGVYALTSSRRE